jgi:hypothetical protein
LRNTRGHNEIVSKECARFQAGFPQVSNLRARTFP